MFWPADIIKHGLPALVGFLLGLVAVAVIGPTTNDGKLLLIGTVVCLTLIVSFVLKKLVAYFSSGKDKSEGEE